MEPKAVKAAAVYLRVSSKSQSHQSQEPDLERWASSYEGPVKWYRDTASGKTMDRPAWKQLEEDMRAGKIAKIVVWKLDRLGRTARELLVLRDELVARKVDLLLVCGGVMSLDSAEGRMMFTVITAFAEYEREIRAERQAAGIAVARAQGKFRGRKVGTTKAKPAKALKLQQQGLTLSDIAKTLGVARSTVVVYLRNEHAKAKARATADED